MAFTLATVSPLDPGLHVPISRTNPLALTLGRRGLPPADHSVNPAGPTGTFLLATVPANANRGSLTAQNQGPQPLQLVLDDGSGTTGTVSYYALPGTTGTAGPITYAQYYSNAFKGRMQVYGSTGAGASIASIFEN